MTLRKAERNRRRFAATWERSRVAGGGRVRCHLCGDVVAIEDATIEHVVARCFGGGQTRDNLAIAHRACNNHAGGMLKVWLKRGGFAGVFLAHDRFWRWARIFNGHVAEVSVDRYQCADDAWRAARGRAVG